MASIDLRSVDTDEADEASDRLTFRAFGHGFDAASYERRKPLRRTGHFVVASRIGEDAGTGGTYDYDLTVPGSTTVPAAGITAVGVRPDHRRQGVLTAVMARLLDDAVDRGQVAALLYASEFPIYGRYGFGVAAPRAEAEILVRRGAFRAETPMASGRVRAYDLADAEGLVPVLQQVHAEAVLRRPGELSRSPATWRVQVTQRSRRDDRLFLVHHDPSGAPRGYASYTVTDDWGGHGPDHRIQVHEVVAASDAVELAVWRALFDHDLVQRLTAYTPVDWLVRDALTDSWATRMRWAGHSMWARLLDVPAALAARRYRTPGSLALRVTDDRDAVAGTYRLEAGDDGTGSVTRTVGEPDLCLPGSVLAALWLGGSSAGRLVRSGRIVEETPGAAVRADLMFGWDPAPFTTEEF